jgi:hypothetical protein
MTEEIEIFAYDAEITFEGKSIGVLLYSPKELSEMTAEEFVFCSEHEFNHRCKVIKERLVRVKKKDVIYSDRVQGADWFHYPEFVSVVERYEQQKGEWNHFAQGE